jgi:hypothetical protein
MVSDVMNAIDLLKSQHRTLRKGWHRIGRAISIEAESLENAGAPRLRMSSPSAEGASI